MITMQCFTIVFFNFGCTSYNIFYTMFCFRTHTDWGSEETIGIEMIYFINDYWLFSAKSTSDFVCETLWNYSFNVIIMYSLMIFPFY